MMRKWSPDQSGTTGTSGIVRFDARTGALYTPTSGSGIEQWLPGRSSDDSAVLGDVVTSLCERVGLTAADLDAVLLRRSRGEQVTGAMLAIEGAHALEGKLSNVAVLDSAGFRMIGLVHFFDNAFAGSSAGMMQGGLTPLGDSLVVELERRRIIIDLAHASAKTIDDVLAVATRPVVVSHTGVKATCDSPRNLSDDQIRRIAATGGVIGIGYWEEAVCDLAPASIARAISHVVAVGGIDHVALGSDFDGATVTRFDASQLAQVTQALVDAGFEEGEIAKILGGNAVRVLRAGLPTGVAGGSPTS